MAKFIGVVVGVVEVAVGIITANPALIVSGVLTIASSVASILLTPKSKQQDRQAAVTTLQIGEGPRAAGVGECVTAGGLVDVFNYGGKYGTDWEVMVVDLFDHECDALLGFWVNDTYVAYAGDGPVAGYNGQLEVHWRSGALGQDIPAIVLNGPDWTAADVGEGICKVVVAYKADAADAKTPIWTAGRPGFLWHLRAAKCYIPRKDSTLPGGSGAHRANDPSTWEWTENAIDCRYKWVRGFYAGNRTTDPTMLLVGRGLGPVEAPPVNTFAPANLCDELVDGEPRYRVGGVIMADSPYSDTEDMFALACGGVILQPQGSVEVEPGQAKAPVAFITDDDMLVGSKATRKDFLSRASPEWVNTVVPRYIEPTQKWADHGAPIRRDDADVIADRAPREQTLSLALVHWATQAGRVGEIARRLGRLWKRYGVVLGPAFCELEAGDWIVWTSRRYFKGGSVTFRIDGSSVDQKWQNALQLREISASVYSEGAFIAGQAVANSPGAPPAVGQPGAAAWALNAVQLTSGGAAIPALSITGASDDAGAEQIRFEYLFNTGANPATVAAWTGAVALPPSITRQDFSAVVPGATYYAAVSYVVRGVPGPRRILGPVTVGVPVALADVNGGLIDSGAGGGTVPRTGVLNSAISISSTGTLSGAGGGAVTYTGLGGGTVGREADLRLGGSFLKDSAGSILGDSTVKNSAVTISAAGTLSGAGGGAVTFSGLGGGAVGLQPDLRLGGSYLKDSVGTVLGDATVKNSAVTISAGGALSGAGGGSVTFAGLGGGVVGQQADLRLGGIYLKDSGGTGLTDIGVKNSAVSISSAGVLSGAGGGAVTFSGLGGGSVGLQSDLRLGGSYLKDSSGVVLGDSAVKNSAVSISSAGVLSGAGGGSVTITGLGYSGDLAATRNRVARQATDPGYTEDFAQWDDTSAGSMVVSKVKLSGAWQASASYGAKAGTNLFDSANAALGDASVKNSAVTISAAGVLSGAGGGSVTIAGLGYSGDLNATLGAKAGTNLVDSTGVSLGDSAIKNTAVSISAGGVLSGAGGGAVTYSGIGGGAVGLQADLRLGGSYLKDSVGTLLGDATVKNSAVTISAAGALSGAGGGSVTFAGLGGGAVGQQPDLRLGGIYLKDSGGVALGDATVKNSAVTISAAGTLSGAGGGTVTFSGLGGGAVGQQADLRLGGVYLKDSAGTALADSTVKNSAVTISAAGALSGAGGGTVTFSGLGGGAVGQQPDLRFGGSYLKDSAGTILGDSAVKNSAVTISAAGALSGAGGGAVTFSGLGGGAVGLQADLRLGGVYLKDSAGSGLTDAAVKNSAITISAGGALAGAGGGSLTALGLETSFGVGLRGDNLIPNATFITDMSGWSVLGGTATRTAAAAGDPHNYLRCVGGTTLAVSSSIPIPAGRTMYLSFWKRCVGGAGYQTAVNYYYTNSAGANNFGNQNDFNGANGVWTFIQMTIPSGNGQVSLTLYNIGINAGAAGTYQDVTGFRLSSTQESADVTIENPRVASSEIGATKGDNLIPNADLNDGTVGWGSQVVNFTRTAGAAGDPTAWHWTNSNGDTFGTGGPTRIVTLPAHASKLYLSGWFKNTVAGQTAQITVYFSDAAAAFVSASGMTSTTTGTGWEQKSAVIAVPSSAAYFTVYLNAPASGKIALPRASVVEAGATLGAQSGVNLKDSSGTALGDAAVKNSAVTISAAGALTGAGGGTVTIAGLGYSGDLNATLGAKAGTNLVDSGGSSLGDAAVKNSAVTISAAGALSGAGGGSVTMSGLDAASGTGIISKTSRLNTSGQANDSRLLTANATFGLRSLKDAPTFSDTDNSGSVTLNVGSINYYSDWGSTITFPSGGVAGCAYGTQYFVFRTGVDPVNAPTGTGWTVNTALVVATSSVYVGFYTTRATGATPSPPPPPPPSGGGSGGLTCVAADAWVETRGRGFVAARDIIPGDMLRVLTDDREDTRWEPCTGNEVATSDAVRITAGGFSLRVAASTPITLRDGSITFAPLADGLELPTYRGRLAWESAAVVPIGAIEVAHIHCGGATYAAGDEAGRSILTHNPVKP